MKYKDDLGNKLIRNRKYKLARILSRIFFNCEVAPSSHIGDGTFFAHNGMGTLVTDNVYIGKNCLIGQQVLIGAKDGKVPYIGDDVIINPYSIIIGDIIIGDNTVIGAGTFVDKYISPNSVVYNKKELVIKND